MPHHAITLLLTLGQIHRHRHTHMHTRYRQECIVETRHASATGLKVPGLKISSSIV